MPSSRSRRLILLICLLATGTALGVPVVATGQVDLSAGNDAQPPNIVFILTDDERWDTLWALPQVQAQLIDHGVTFSNSFVANSLCCPSRTTALTGEYSHSTGVYRTIKPGQDTFDDTSTIATWLQGAGYRTGLIGKYLNGYEDPTYIPPGWSSWFAFTSGGGNGNYYDYTISQNGVPVTYGSDPSDYSTDVFSAQADTFIRGTDPSQSLFLYFAPNAPHGPTTPADKYKDAFPHLKPRRPPNYNEADISDKPGWMRGVPQFGARRDANIRSITRRTYQTLLSVDDAVDTIMTALTDTGRLSNTMVVFASDNGYLLGEHRLMGKLNGYEESIRVPLVIRYDPMTSSPRTETHLVANIDYAPTFAEIAGVSAPGAEGVSLVPLLTRGNVVWRTDFLVEHYDGWQWNVEIPTYCQVRSERYSYLVYGTADEELYDIQADRYQLTNLVGDPGYQSELDAMRTRVQQLCQPPPPGFQWPPWGMARWDERSA